MEWSFENLLRAYTHIVVADFLRYFIPASIAFLLFWVLLKRVLTHRFIQARWPKASSLWFEFRYSLSTVLIFAAIGTCLHFANQNGLIHIYHNTAEYGWGYLLLSLVVMVVFHDTYFYWTHRWMHLPKIYKYVHRVHHVSTNPSPWAAYSFHPLEAVVQALVLPLILIFLPVHKAVLLLFLGYMIVRNVHGHLGFELFPKGFIRNRWLNWHTTTTHHNMHHHQFNCNYGLYFLWWDKWMKTKDKNYESHFQEVTSRKRATSGKALVSLLLLWSGALSAQSPSGKWMTFHEETGHPLSIIHIYQNPNTDSWEGTIDSIIIQPNQGENPVCTHCPGVFKDKSVIGMNFLWDFEQVDEEWVDGKILDPESGTIYSSKIWSSGEREIQVRGYGGPFELFYRTQTWRQLNGKGIEGVWEIIDDRYEQVKAHVRLEVRGTKLTGTILKLFLLPHEGNFPLCVECDDELKNTPIVGLRLMSGFVNQSTGWEDGTILDPANGLTYSARFWLKDEKTLVIRGYWGPFYRSQEWKRCE